MLKVQKAKIDSHEQPYSTVQLITSKVDHKEGCKVLKCLRSTPTNCNRVVAFIILLSQSPDRIIGAVSGFAVSLLPVLDDRRTSDRGND